MSPLGNATALDCANYTVSMFSDLTKIRFKTYCMTEGFQMGVSQEVMEMFETFTENIYKTISY
jgi:enoyl-[acyl-carrier protein] reductase I